jgi:hypothetical protein
MMWQTWQLFLPVQKVKNASGAGRSCRMSARMRTTAYAVAVTKHWVKIMGLAKIK